MPLFTGSGVAIITPMHADGSVNLEKLDEILEWQIAEGTDAVIICGTTGESPTLDVPEHMDVIRHCVETVNGRIPVIAGTGSNSTQSAIEMSREAAAFGVDGLLLVTPYYNKATQSGLIRHYTAIAESVPGTPIIMYNVPSRTGTNIAAETAAALVRSVENIVGIKEASGNISQVAKVKQLGGEELQLYSGNDDQVIPLESLGGVGVISVLANVAPKFTHEMATAYLNGDTQKAAAMQLACLPLCDALFCEVNPIPVKTAMNLMGWDVGPLRGPLFEMDPAHVELLKKELTAFGICLA
ncbi:MAG: 4-hydroxy-tetrahydrodipicolinate synthase [Eubacterium sp.]|nr:4-hydroxy-tetrahydrodipicolinate synthase [Eubacterium sp.]